MVGVKPFGVCGSSVGFGWLANHFANIISSPVKKHSTALRTLPTPYRNVDRPVFLKAPEFNDGAEGAEGFEPTTR